MEKESLKQIVNICSLVIAVCMLLGALSFFISQIVSVSGFIGYILSVFASPLVTTFSLFINLGGSLLSAFIVIALFLAVGIFLLVASIINIYKDNLPTANAQLSALILSVILSIIMFVCTFVFGFNFEQANSVWFYLWTYLFFVLCITAFIFSSIYNAKIIKEGTNDTKDETTESK